MPELISGIDTQQKVVTVPNSDEEINGMITTQAEDGWLASQLTLFEDASSVIILFSRNVTIET